MKYKEKILESGGSPLIQWFEHRGWKAFDFQCEAWINFVDGKQGLVNAPTGSGKTYSLAGAIVLEALSEKSPVKNQLRLIWITPIRALAKEIKISCERMLEGVGLDWQVAIRTGDTDSKEKDLQLKHIPEILITTPESLHVLLARKSNASLFQELRAIVVDEWHELLGSKRGVQVELALSRLRTIAPVMRTWGISATIGNLDEAMQVLLGPGKASTGVLIQSHLQKTIVLETILPDEIERYPWAGHLGIRLLKKVVPIILSSKSTLIFTNTRAQSEIWYQKLLETAPELAGQMAMHHGSISKDLRFWVEDALHEGTIKAVVCTSSLDLGVDFRPVDTVIQIGGPKGVARFMQRAGRSGHQPGASSKIYFVPTHSLEIAESAALRDAMYAMALEERQPHVRSFDVLAQYLMTLAVADGFNQNEIFDEVISTFCFQSMDKAEWLQMLDFLCTGGNSLGAYEEFQKMERTGDFYFVSSRKVATRHRLSIGTIVSDVMMNIRFNTGGHIGSVEEWFVSRLNPGDVFWFAGRSLELVRIKGLNVFVKKSKSDKGIIPSWQGGRMPLSSQMSAMLRKKLADMAEGIINDAESDKLIPLIQLQQEVSIVPALTQFLIEKLQSKDGCHLFLYPFEGRLVHEGLASLIAWRIARYKPYSFSLAFNDYGFELLSDQEIPLTILSDADVFSLKNLEKDVQSSINAVELARRRFKEIASVSGMIFKGYPGKSVREKHLQSSSHLLFEVLSDYDPYNLLLRQAYDESLYFQLEITRLRAALERINSQKHVEISLEQASPFSFPIMVDRLREKMSTEQLEDRIRKMKLV